MLAFSLSKTAISLFVGTSDALFQKHIYLISGVNILHTYTINTVSFYYSWYGAICINMELLKRQYTDKTLTLRKCMCMRASELRKFRNFYIL